jgi:predicted Zn-dependent protease
MRATLTFNLPEDRNEYSMANNASAMYSALWDIQQKLRSLDKYGIEEYYGQTREELVSKLRQEINEIIGDCLNGVE